jgi:biopolymer transport protein ExbD
MARIFRRKHQAHAISELNVTNLVDLAFTLLIVFMLAAPLIQQEQTIAVNLPTESAAKQSKPDPAQRFESVTVLADGSITLGNRPMTLKLLTAEFAKWAEQPKPPVIRLRVDAKATAQQWIGVLSEAKKLNLPIQVDTQVAK